MDINTQGAQRSIATSIPDPIKQLIERGKRNEGPLEVNEQEFLLLITAGKGVVNGIRNIRHECQYKTQCSVADGEQKYYFYVYTPEPRNWGDQTVQQS